MKLMTQVVIVTAMFHKCDFKAMINLKLIQIIPTFQFSHQLYNHLSHASAHARTHTLIRTYLSDTHPPSTRKQESDKIRCTEV